MMKFGTTFVYNVSPRSECVGTCSDQILQALIPLMKQVHASGLISQCQTIQRRMPDCPAECAGLSNEPLGARVNLYPISREGPRQGGWNVGLL